MKSINTQARPFSKRVEEKFKSAIVGVEKKVAAKVKSRSKGVSKRLGVRSSGVQDKKEMKNLVQTSYLGSVGNALLQRCYMAGGWMQQGFEKVFTLTLFSTNSKRARKNGLNAEMPLEVRPAPLKTSRRYKKSSSKKVDSLLSKAATGAEKSKPQKMTPKDLNFLGKKA